MKTTSNVKYMNDSTATVNSIIFKPDKIRGLAVNNTLSASYTILKRP